MFQLSGSSRKENWAPCLRMSSMYQVYAIDNRRVAIEQKPPRSCRRTISPSHEHHEAFLKV